MQGTNKYLVNQAERSSCIGNGVSASVPQTPPRGAGDRNDSLLYLSCPNSDKSKKKDNEVNNKKARKKGSRGDNETPNNKEYKIMKSLRENIKDWGKRYGEDRIFFLTLTFEENITDHKEAQRRFNNFNRQFNRLNNVQWLYKGIEPQERGALHYHIVGVTDFKMAPDKVDWEAYKKSNEARAKGDRGNMYKYQRIFSKSNVPEVQEMWKVIRKISEGSKMGRSEFLPIRSAGCVAQYVGKYLNKTFASKENGTLPKGVRRFSYSNKAPQPHGRVFSWVKNQKTGLATWREKVSAWAWGVGIRDFDMMREKYGRKWALNQRDEINYYGLKWRKKDLRFGHSKPAVYPNGDLGSPLNHLPKVELTDPFEKSENEIFTEWMGSKKSNFKQHARHYQKHATAELHKKRNAYLYD